MGSLIFIAVCIILLFAIPALVRQDNSVLEALKAKRKDLEHSNDHTADRKIAVIDSNIESQEQKGKLLTIGKTAGMVLTSIALIVAVVNTSLVYVPEGRSAHFTRVWGGSALGSGEIISRDPLSSWTAGTKGPQSEIIRPGTHFRLGINIFNERANEAMEGMLHVPPGQFAVLKAKDGVPMTGERMVAPPWDEDEFTNMLEDAGYFLKTGGMRGVQYTVVPTGSYHINNFLWEVEGMHPESQITTGEVAVVRANVQVDPNQDCTPTDTTTAVPLVPVGCRGVWDQEYEQGTYRFNPYVLSVSKINVRQVNNDHRGNYTRQNISFTTDNEGNIQSSLKPEPVAQGDAIDDAIDIRAEGWNIDQDVSVLWQVIDPPRAVAQLGDQTAIAEFISRITQSQFRIVAQGNDINDCIIDITTGEVNEQCAATARYAMDLIYEREAIEDAAQARIQSDINSYGVRVNNVVMARPNIPPELLMPVLRTQYANRMEQTYIEEEKAAQQRIAVNNANELANRQAILVDADLQNQAANELAKRTVTLAQADKEADELRAEGQRAILNVVGQENVQQQILMQKMLDFTLECGPDCIKVPTFQVTGGSNGGLGLEGFAAILGSSNMAQAVSQFQGDQRPAQPAQ